MRLIGAAERALSLAATRALDRVAFGRPLAAQVSTCTFVFLLVLPLLRGGCWFVSWCGHFWCRPLDGVSSFLLPVWGERALSLAATCTLDRVPFGRPLAAQVG